MKKVVVILKNRFTELNEELFLLENKTIVNQETFEEIMRTVFIRVGLGIINQIIFVYSECNSKRIMIKFSEKNIELCLQLKELGEKLGFEMSDYKRTF
jgi:hypothetical protein